ncbi:MAG TPA: sensor histidine kinase [Actinopolymorphaceae bacterium]|jgi:signal transduction histidine kinase
MADCSAGEPSFRERAVRWWHAGFALIVGLDAAVWLLAPDIRLHVRGVGLAVLAALVGSYVTIGRRALVRNAATWLVLGYLGTLCVAVGVLIHLAEFNHMLLFVAYPHIWAMQPLRRAIGFAAAVTLYVMGRPVVASGFAWDALVGNALTAAMTLGVSVLFCLWVDGIIAESERRKALIAELERTRSELAKAHHREGVLAERQRLATEIHDTLAQGFMSILMLSQGPRSEDQMERIAQLARENLAEARTLIEALTPRDLASHTLVDACARAVDRFRADTGIDARFTVQGEPKALSPNAEIVLLRATQEALANVRKHAAATQVTVCVTYGDHETSVEIRDDGCGFDPTVADGYGLRGMRKRADQVGGVVEVDSSPGKGTTVRVVVT